MRVSSFPIRLGFSATLLAAGVAFVVPPAPLMAAIPAKKVAKRPITHDVYNDWRSIKDSSLSRNGEWLAYGLALQDGDGELVARNLKTGKEWRHPRGGAPVISADGRFVAFAIAPPKLEVDKAKKDKKKPEEMPKAGLGIMDLATGKVETLERVKSFRFAKDGGHFLAALLEKPEAKKTEEKPNEKKAEVQDDESDQRARGAAASLDPKEPKKKEPGTDLVIWELGTGKQTIITEVGEYIWNRSGSWLAYSVSVKEPEKTKGNDKAKADAKTKETGKDITNPSDSDPAKEGVYLWRATEGKISPLLTGKGAYKGLTADDDGTQFAFLSNRSNPKAEASVFMLYGWKDGSSAPIELATANTPGMPEGWAPSEHGHLDFSKDGARLFFGTAISPKAEPKDAPEPVKVDLWHWKDMDLQPMQKVRAEEEKKRSFRAVLHLADRRFVQLGSEELPDIEANDNSRVALGFAPNAYLHLASWDQSYADVYALDLESGAKKLLARKLPWSRRSSDGPGRASHLSPAGKYLFHFDAPARAWMLVPTGGGAVINLTQNLKVAFHDEDHDTPDLAGAYGSAGWTPEDGAFLAYDRFDIWELKPSGARNLTGGAGRKQKTTLRYLRLDPEEKTIPTERPLAISGVNEDTKATGFFRGTWNDVAPTQLIWGDQLMGGLQKAKDSDTVVFTRQRFDVFPDLWSSDSIFSKPVQVTSANPQQADFIWGNQELIEYVNADGKVLKALVARPSNFDPKKKYPLMVYIYEKYSDRLHSYQAPAPGTSINFTRFVSNGYIVLRPDIVYETGYPGKSAMKCVLPAIEKLAASGSIDREHIGIQGHSWGAYQIAYMVGQTNLFKAAEAGAPVSDMVSAYGGVRWGTGMSRAFQYEKSQSRMGGTPWERPMQFIENSPLFWVERVQTPLLMIHNDEDDAVPWYQGIEYFSALRRLDKPVWMFNFNGDKHNLVQRENQKYWTLHMDEFFDHLLLGAPRPEWMDKPVPYIERGKRDLEKVFGKSNIH